MSERFPLNLPRTTQNEEVYANCIRSYLNEIKSLKYQLEQEAARNQDLKSSLTIQKQSSNDLTSRVTALEGANKSLNQQVSELQKYASELQNVSNELVQANVENKRLKSENTSLKQQIEDLLQTTNQNLENQRRIASKHNQLKEKVDDLQQAYEQTANQLKRANQKLSEAQQNNELLQNKYSSKSSEIQKLKSSAQHNESKFSEMNSLVNVLRQRVKSLEDQNKAIAQQHSEEIQNLSKTIFAKEEELQEAQRMSIKLEEQRQVNKEYAMKIQKMQEKCQNLTDALEHSHEQISSLQMQNDSEKTKMQQSLLTLQSKLRENEVKLVKTNSENQDLKQQLADARQEFNEALSLNHTTHQQQVRYLGEKLEKSQGLCKDLASQLGNSPTKGQYNILKDRLKELEKQNSLLREKCDVLSEENSELKRHCKLLEDENRKYREEGNEYAKRLRKTENKAATMSAINQKFQSNERKASALLAQTLDLMDRKQKELQATKRELKALKANSEYSLVVSKLSADDLQRENEEKIRQLKQENSELRMQLQEYQEQKTFIDDLKSRLSSLSTTSDVLDLSSD